MPDVATDPLAFARAVRAASGPWQKCGIARRLAVLEEAGAGLADRRDELIGHLRADGLSTRLANFFGDWIVHAGDPALLRSYAEELSRWLPTGTGGELLIRRPDGVVLLSVPLYSPTIQAATLFSILLPGNGVIVRAPENDGGTRFLAESILRPALVAGGFSPDLVQVITGKSRTIIAALMPSPDIDTIVFFGNFAAGQALVEPASKHGKKLVFELEGSDSQVVWKDAPLDRAVASASQAWFGSSQPCAVPKHILVHGDVFDRFVEAFTEAARACRTIEIDPEHGLLLRLFRPDAYLAALEEVRSVGEVRCGGYPMAADGEPNPEGPYAAPTVVTLPFQAVRDRPLLCFDEEICFPLIPVVRFDGDDDTIADDMVRLIGRIPFGLRLSVWSASAAVLGRFVRDVRSVGMILCNEDHARSPHFASPWGGPKRSGGPRGESHFFWEQTSRLQAILCDGLRPAQFAAIQEQLGIVYSPG